MAARLLHFILLCSLRLLTNSTSGEGLRLVEEPGGVVVAARNSGPLSIPCRPSSPQAALSWTHDGQPLLSDSRRKLLNNRTTLLIKKVVHKKKWSLAVGESSSGGASDAGEYRCTARSSQGTLVSAPFHLRIAGTSHEFSKSPDNVTGVVGGVIRLMCSIDSIPQASVRWHRDSHPLPQHDRYFYLDSGILYIKNLKKEDSGRYKCEGSTKYTKKSRWSKEGIVTVVEGPLPPGVRPFLSGAPPSSLLAYPNSSSLVCATPFPRATLSWIHTKPDGTNTTISTNKGLNILQIGNNSMYKNGSYYCLVSQANKVTASKAVNVSFYSAPRFIQKPPAYLTWPTGKTLHLPCEVTGTPEPRITWYKNGQQLLINGKVKQRKKDLTIGTVEGADSGIYQCEVDGGESATARLLVTPLGEQPPRPVNVTCHSVSALAIRVSWDTPKFKQQIPGFTVHSTPSDGGEEDRDLVLNKSFILKEKLSPYTNYTFYVRSWAGKTLSESSTKVICSTAESVPKGWPEVTLRAVSHCCLMITWQPPTSSQARGSIKHYKVQWKLRNQTFINFQLLPAYIKQYTIRDVYMGEEYLVRVMAATSLGWPENQDLVPWKNLTLPQNSYSRLPPPFINIHQIDSNSITIEWFLTEGPINGFNLYYKKLQEDILGAVILPSNVSHFILSSLEAGCWYEISVTCFDEDSEGEPCPVIVQVESKGGTQLEAPRRLSAQLTSPTSFNVSWLPTHQANFYLLEYKLTDSFNQSCTPAVVNKTWVEVKNLKIGSSYEFSVRAKGVGNLTSAASGYIQAQTLSKESELIKWRRVSNSSVEVTWDLVSNTDTILQYRVSYSSDVDPPGDLAWQQKNLPSTSTSFILTGLKPNLNYLVRVEAIPLSGNMNLQSASINFTLPFSSGNVVTTYRPENKHKSHSDKILGILVGCAISICFTGLCAMTMVYRRRCFKPEQRPPPQQNPSAHLEMLSLTHSLTHLNTKGDFPNGPVNGLKLPLIMNGRIPNGHLQDKHLHITENPQFEGGGNEADEGSSRTTDEGDSLLSGGEGVTCADDSSICALDPSPEPPLSTLKAPTDMLPDDGFYESNHVLT